MYYFIKVVMYFTNNSCTILRYGRCNKKQQKRTNRKKRITKTQARGSVYSAESSHYLDGCVYQRLGHVTHALGYPQEEEEVVLVGCLVLLMRILWRKLPITVLWNNITISFNMNLEQIFLLTDTWGSVSTC